MAPERCLLSSCLQHAEVNVHAQRIFVRHACSLVLVFSPKRPRRRCRRSSPRAVLRYLGKAALPRVDTTRGSFFGLLWKPLLAKAFAAIGRHFREGLAGTRREETGDTGRIDSVTPRLVDSTMCINGTSHCRLTHLLVSRLCSPNDQRGMLECTLALKTKTVLRLARIAFGVIFAIAGAFLVYLFSGTVTSSLLFNAAAAMCSFTPYAAGQRECRGSSRQ